MPKRDFILLYAYNAVLVGLPWPLSKQRSCVCNIDLWGILQEMNEQHCSQQEILNWGTSQILWDCYWATCEGTGWPGHRLLPKLKVVPISTIQVLAHQGKQRDLCSVPANRTTWGPQTQPFQFTADAGSSFSMQSYHLPLLLNPDLTGWLSPPAIWARAWVVPHDAGSRAPSHACSTLPAPRPLQHHKTGAQRWHFWKALGPIEGTEHSPRHYLPNSHGKRSATELLTGLTARRN